MKNNAKLTGRNEHRLYALYIISVLREYSDEKHPMSISQIIEILSEDPYKAYVEKTPDVKTLRNQLNTIISVIGKDSTIDERTGRELDNSLQMGFYIGQSVKDEDGSYKDFDPDDDNDENSAAAKATRYYYYKSIFDESEVSMIIDSLEALNYLSSKDISSMVLKITGLSPYGMESYRKKNYKHNGTDPRLSDPQAWLLENLAILHDKINNNKFVYIQKCYYDENGRLQTVYPNTVLIKPIRLMFNNGYYYLIAVQHSADKENYFTVHYRVDRIMIFDDPIPSSKDLSDYIAEDPGDAADYHLHHPVMYNDDMVDVEFAVNINKKSYSYMLNVLHDYFGNAANITKTDDDHLNVKVNVSKGGMRLIATEYCNYIHIISPADLRAQVIEDLKKGLNNYT